MPISIRTIFWKSFLAAGVWAWVATCHAEFPARPTDGEFIHDFADLIDESSAKAIRGIQYKTFKESGVPIVVVTIRRMSDYVLESSGIEEFARQWFDHWGIGTAEKNDGILILVSHLDRKARIELGADWGRQFDDFSQRLMDRKMVPEFKKGNYGAGLEAAVASLPEIAAAGPEAGPPEPGMVDRILDHPVMVFNQEKNPIAGVRGGSLILLGMIVLGSGCVIAGIFLPNYRKPLLIFGMLLIALALFFWIVVIIFVVISKFRGGGDSGGFGSGGGGFGGGFSGGGGASGSW